VARGSPSDRLEFVQGWLARVSAAPPTLSGVVRATRAVVERRTLIRRGFHMLSSLFVVYYWVPETIVEVDLTRQEVAVLGLSLFAVFEAYRIYRGWVFLGLREYERRWVAGYFWGASGYVLALLFFPQRFAMLTILGTTLIDPALGEIRKTPWKRWGPAVGFVLWCAIEAALILLVTLSIPWIYVTLGAAMAVAAEAKKFRRVDDNFVMNIVPLLGLTALAAVTGL